MIVVRRAKLDEAAAIGSAHVAAWRSAYPGILPQAYLAGMSVGRQAVHYARAIAGGAIVVVAVSDREPGAAARVVGFATAGRPRHTTVAEGEIETLYVLDDFREQGLGRRLLRAAASQLAKGGCRSAFLWVLRENPSRWFYEHLGGQPAMAGDTGVGGVSVPQIAYAWDPIDRLLASTPAK